MKVQVEGIKSAGLRNAVDTVINPATEDTLQSIAAGVGVATTIADGNKTVPTPGTAVKLTASVTSIKKVLITAMEANTDMVVVGGSTVVAAKATRRGIPLPPLSSLEVFIDDLSKIYIDAVVAGNGVTYMTFN